MFDAELYRSKAEVEEWKRRCPILNFTSRLRSEGWLDDAALVEMESDIATEIERAVAYAEAGTWEPIGSLTQDVYTVKTA
jgi:TPP-dependent pyruvate/acetoin dehydrogenase alpha subunit